MKRIYYTLIIITISLMTTIRNGQCQKYINKLGIGASNQLINNFPAISLKLQKTRSTAVGVLLNLSTEENGGGYGAGLKYYKIIFDEPSLNFYASSLLALINQTNIGEDHTGFQVDLTLGSEFHFPSLESIGFSFEFGVSLSKLDDFTIKTVGYHVVKAGVHFYL